MKINRNALYGDELLVAVFASFKKDERKFRISNEGDIVNALYEAKRTGEFEPLFENYPFDVDGFEPTSKQLMEGLDTLQQSSILGRMNPYLVDYSVSDAVDNRYEKFIQTKVLAQNKGQEMLAKLTEIVRSKLLGQSQIKHEPA